MGLLDTVVGTDTVAAAPPPVASGSVYGGLPRCPAMACVRENAYMLADGKGATFKTELEGVYYFLRDGKTIPLKAADIVGDLGGAAHPNLAGPATASVLAPDAPKSDPTGAAAPKKEHKMKIDDSQKPTGDKVATPATPAPTTPAAPVAADRVNALPAAPAPEPEAKGKRGRPAGSKAGITLLINCACSTETTDLNALVASFGKQLAEKAGIPDLRLAPKKDADGGDHPCAYGGWKAILSMAILGNLPSGMCSINSGELNDPVIEALVGVAGTVIRGSL